MSRRVLYFFLCLMSLFFVQKADAVFLSGKTPYQIKVGDVTSSYRVFAYFVLPNKNIPIRLIQPNFISGLYQIRANSGSVARSAPHQWTWKAPAKPGLYPVYLIHRNRPDTLILNMIVLTPFSQVKNGAIGNYKIGYYPKSSSVKSNYYGRPKGFIKVTRDLLETSLSPHFKVKQFLCKQNSKYPKYVVLREELILKLELILQLLHDEGISCRSLTIMSGYRTPHYNKILGNVKYSQHLFGGAADFYVDENPKDGQMDDLNKDSEINVKDAQYLLQLIKVLSYKKEYRGFEGGLAAYKRTASHGPFVHTDVRGYEASWNHID